MSADLMATNGLVFIGTDGEPFTTSLVIAEETGNEHASVIRLVRDNLDDLNEIGRVRFEIRPFATPGGTQRREIAELDEPAAALLMTYLRNSVMVKDFKKRLVGGFYAMRQMLAERQVRMLPKSREELLAVAVLEAQQMLTEKNEIIAALEPKAEFYDELMDADGTYTMQATANVLGWGRNIMMRELRRAGVLQGNNLPYRRYSHHFKVVPGTRTHPKTGEIIPTATTHVLPSGLSFLRKKLDNSPVLAEEMGG